MENINEHWKIITSSYVVLYLAIASTIFFATKKGNIIMILAIGLAVILPYIMYNMLRKKPLPFDEPDIKTLY